MEALMSLLKEVRGGKVLDIATGVGDFVEFIDEFREVESVTAIDTDERLRAQVEKRTDKFPVSYMVMNALKLDFADESFDTVCLSNSIHHLEDYPRVFSEMLRVLKRNGQLVINEMYCDGLTDAQNAHVLMHHFSASIDMDHNRYHAKTYTKKKLHEIIEGISGKQIRMLEYKFPNSDVMNPEFIQAQSERMKKLITTLESRNEPRINDYKEQTKLIIEYIEKNGFDSASSIIAVIDK